MNISYGWVRELAGAGGGSGARSDLPAWLLRAEEAAARITKIAASVEKSETVGVGLEGVVVARVLEVGPHPQADRLSLCQVDRGNGEPVQVVCGAPVIVQGGAYAHVAPGNRLPSGFEIGSRKIRGVVSHGMLCSEAELELGRDRGGIMRLGDDAEPGVSVADYLGLPDTLMVLDLNPNRIDLACHMGVARELAPDGKHLNLRPSGGPEWTPRWCDGESEAEGAGVRVEVKDPSRCVRYLAAVVRGVVVGPSPGWLAGRLLAAGLTPINNVVDATNYVLMERGQPLHAFDLACLRGGGVGVRPAREGEELTTLDGQTRPLTGRSSVIHDAGGAVALAGVMGGHDSEVTADTSDILIECAHFPPLAVRETARETGLATDASYRFERGIDATAQGDALRRCVELILATAGGKADPEALRAGAPPPAPFQIPLRIKRVNQVLGFGLDEPAVAAALDPIGLTTSTDAPGVLDVSVPGWRGDIEREIDLVEEVARRVGFDKPAEKVSRFRPSAVPDDPSFARMDRVRQLFVGRGLLEARSLTFVPGDFRGSRADLAVPNPLSAEEGYLRPAIVPVLLRRLEHNYRRGHRAVRLFEIGTVFGVGTGEGREKYTEEIRVGFALTGGRFPRHWLRTLRDFDIWDLKGIAVEAAERLCGGSVRSLAGDCDEDRRGADEFGASWLEWPGFGMYRDDELVGMAGLVRAEAVKEPAWAGLVIAGEFRLDAVRPSSAPRYEPLPSFPATRRDISLAVPRNVDAAAVEATMSAASPRLLCQAELFDLYSEVSEGDALRGLSWSLEFRAPDRTLTDAEVDVEMGKIAHALEEGLSVAVRGS